jgi:hypothetical protein
VVVEAVNGLKRLQLGGERLVRVEIEHMLHAARALESDLRGPFPVRSVDQHRVQQQLTSLLVGGCPLLKARLHIDDAEAIRAAVDAIWSANQD